LQEQEKQAVEKEKFAIDNRLRKFWSRNTEILKKDCKSVAGIDKFAGMSRTKQTHTHNEQSIVFDKFLAAYKNELTLSDDAQVRLVLYAIAQSEVYADLTLVENWRKAFDRLQELGAFAKDTVGVKEKPKAAPAPKTFEELNTSSNRAEEKLAKKLVVEGVIADAKPIWNEFMEFLRNTYGVELHQADKDACIKYCIAKNLGFNHRAFDLCRVHVLNLKSPDELLCDGIEANKVPLTDYLAKRDLIRRQQKIQESVRGQEEY